ncbi:ComEA family DNA-binding protein [Nodosilinea sp. LEGE 07088]|uniref:ComEA family DNA-binding protein n=1 Tax=Nodosilinea sp. LEGE 07088 TaxID=2777968 RepID=UPI00187EB2D7|nr:ComEA family DNA-binding protein [Nodosilinea sp. LEGE 07088]MBE9136998.1 ComEA family DNA-binding protein [Nodosilinea sp. LEGE 07088]
MLKRWQALRGQLHPLANRLSQEPGYRLRSYREVYQAAGLGFSIDVNRATVDDWLRLPGLSIRQAQRLVRLRQTGVQFHCLEDLAAALSIAPTQIAPLGAVLSFCYYDGQGDTLPTISLNQATTQQLCGVPGMSPALAEAIVQERSQRGPYRDLADLQRRLGLAPDVVQTLMYYLHI